VEAVHDESPGRLRIGEREKRQHENVGVPEYMPLIGSPAQPASANGHAIILRISHTRQMIDGEAKRALCRGISVKPDIGFLPSRQPSVSMFFDHAIHRFDRTTDMFARGLARLFRFPGAVYRDHPVEPIGFALADLEAFPALDQIG
jgi:hypothetical protein